MEAYLKKSLLGVERAMEELEFLSNKKTFVVLHASGAAFHSDGSYAFVVMATYQYAVFAVPSTSAMQPCIFLSIFICVWADFLVGSDLGNDARTLGVGTEKSWRAPWSTTSMTQVESMVFTWRDRLQVSFVEALTHHLSLSLKGGTQGPYVKESTIRNNVLPGNSIQKHESLLDGF